MFFLSDMLANGPPALAHGCHLLQVAGIVSLIGTADFIYLLRRAVVLRVRQ